MSEFLKKRYETEQFMKNVLSRDNAQRLHSVSVTRGYCFLEKMIFDHDVMCYCFRCPLKKNLIDLLIKRNHQRYLFHLHVNNYTKITEEQVFEIY